eukprot:17203_1
MSHRVDYFDDAELTLLSVEILHDMTDSFDIDPNDPFILALAEDIEKEALRQRTESSNNGHGSGSSSSSPPSLSLSSCSSGKTSGSIDSRGPVAGLGRLALSPPHLSLHESSTQSVHSVHIVTQSVKPTVSTPSPAHANAKYSKEESFFPDTYLTIDIDVINHMDESDTDESDEIHENSLVNTLSPPQIHLPFAWGSISSDVSSCLSPRCATPDPKTCAIPVFCERTDSEKQATNAKRYVKIKQKQKEHLDLLSSMLIPRNSIRSSMQGK